MTPSPRALRLQVAIAGLLIGLTFVFATAGIGGLALLTGTVAAAAALAVIRDLVNREDQS